MYQCPKEHAVVVLREHDHKYTMEFNLPSASTILEMIFGDTYVGVNEKYMANARQRGTCVHKQLEMYIKESKTIGCICNVAAKTKLQHTDLFDKFRDYLDTNLDLMDELTTEQAIIEPHALAGTIDLAIKRGNQVILIDYKTTSSLNSDKVRIQLIIYQLLLGLEKEHVRLWALNGHPSRDNIRLYEFASATQKDFDLINETIKTYHEVRCGKN